MTSKMTDDYTRKRDAAAEKYAETLPGAKFIHKDHSAFKAGADWGREQGRAERDAETRAKAGSVGDLVQTIERLERELAECQKERNGAEDAAVGSAMLLATVNQKVERLERELEQMRSERDEALQDEKEIERLTAERDELAEIAKRRMEQAIKLQSDNDRLRAELAKREGVGEYSIPGKRQGEPAKCEHDWAGEGSYAVCVKCKKRLPDGEAGAIIEKLKAENAELRSLLDDINEYVIDADKERDAAREIAGKLAGALSQDHDAKAYGNSGCPGCEALEHACKELARAWTGPDYQAWLDHNLKLERGK